MMGKTNVKVKPNKKVQYVNYIESTGTQYIDTGVPASIDLKVVADIAPLEGGYPFGVAPAQNVQYYGMRLGTSNKPVQGYFGTLGTNGSYPQINNLWGVGERCVLIANDNKKFYYDDTLVADYTSTNNTLEFSLTPITICALNGIYLATKMSMKIYSFKMYEGDVLIRDFRPAKDGTGVYCLYDEVGKRYYYNQGTGEFTGGVAT